MRWEIVDCLSLEPRRKTGSMLAAQVYIWLKLLTGMRRSDMLRLTMNDLWEDGIYVEPNKTKGTTGKRQIIEWSAELRAAVEMAKTARPDKKSDFLFCNCGGNGYFNDETGRAGDWESLWKNFVKRVMTETKVTGHFTEHDLRAKCASDAFTLEHARSLLGHANTKITDKVYRKIPEIVKPLR